MAAPGCSSYHSSAEWGPAGCALDFSPSCLFFFHKEGRKKRKPDLSLLFLLEQEDLLDLPRLFGCRKVISAAVVSAQ